MNTATVPNTALSAELSELLSVVEPASVADVLLERAFGHRATDIHLDPTSAGTRVRYRIDGELQDILPIPSQAAASVISRIKVMAELDITEKRMPQDGHISSRRFDGLDRDIRVSSLPTVHGERLVLRLMPDPSEFSVLADLGFLPKQLESVETFLKMPYGLLLVVGPVGSGKSTTLYSLLRELNVTQRSLVTIEDPVERLLPGANQVQVDARTGLGFATALRAVLRQDPNIMAIGEIRDAETAAIACRAAMTGVLVLSTLHASTAASAIEVLKQYGVPKLVISEALRGVISQRLIRRISIKDREDYIPEDDLVRRYDLEHGVPIARGIPTDRNFNTGYEGRVAVFENLQASSAIRDAVDRGATADELTEIARREGMATLRESAQQLVREKITSVHELQRIIVDTDASAGTQPLS
ncbi:MAG: type II/IV secretion system protein [Planctomycetales bacterium]|nr:type II/IV secretion system protein [Planctomycetales bacterium]